MAPTTFNTCYIKSFTIYEENAFYNTSFHRRQCQCPCSVIGTNSGIESQGCWKGSWRGSSPPHCSDYHMQHLQRTKRLESSGYFRLIFPFATPRILVKHSTFPTLVSTELLVQFLLMPSECVTDSYWTNVKFSNIVSVSQPAHLSRTSIYLLQ